MILETSVLRAPLNDLRTNQLLFNWKSWNRIKEKSSCMSAKRLNQAYLTLILVNQCTRLRERELRTLLRWRITARSQCSIATMNRIKEIFQNFCDIELWSEERIKNILFRLFKINFNIIFSSLQNASKNRKNKSHRIYLKIRTEFLCV
jgi:hypothetical protein